MDKTVPKGAAILLDFVRLIEVGTEGREGYDIIYGHNQGKLPKPVTRMTIGEIIDAQRWGTEVERILSAFQAGGGIIFPDLATAGSSLAYGQNAMAWVMGDPVTGNNGIYRKVGASGSGSWVRLGDLPFSNIPLTNVGAGTADAIIATSSLPMPTMPGAALFTVNIVADNTGPVTINGKPWRTNVGNEFVAGGIKAGGIYLFLDNGDHFRAVTDQDVSALVATAEDAAEAAEAARDAALGGVPNAFPPTRTALSALDTSNTTSAYLTEAGREGQFIWRAGDYSAQIMADTAQAVYVKANSVAATDGAWVRQHDGEYFVKWFGAAEDGATNDVAAIQAAVDLSLFLPRPIPIVMTGSCFVNSSVVINRPVGTAAGAETLIFRGRGPFAGIKSGLTGDIIDSTLDFIAPNDDPPCCNITFENITWIGDGTTNPRCVSGKFLKVEFNHCRFNAIRAVQTGSYLQSWYFIRNSMIATPGRFIQVLGRLYDFRFDKNDMESCGGGIKSFEGGVYGGSIVDNLYQNGGQFFAQAKGYGLVISGNYTELNTAPDYQLSDPINFGADGEHHGTQFTGNFMAIAGHAGYQVIVGRTSGMIAGGNYSNDKLYDTSNTVAGSFKSIGDRCEGAKFSTLGSFDGDHAGDYAEAVLSSTSAIGLTTGVYKTITSFTLPAGDWDVNGVVGFAPAATTSASRYSASISLTNNALGEEGRIANNVFSPFVNGGFTVNYPTPTVRLSLATATTVYLVGLADFTVSTMSAFGKITARKAGGQ